MQSDWLYIGLFLVVGALVPTAAIVTSSILSPKKPNHIKQSTYECGMETVGENWVQFKAQYYVFALVFLVFDVETVFLFPWRYRWENCRCMLSLKGSSSFLSSLRDLCLPGVRVCWNGFN